MLPSLNAYRRQSIIIHPSANHQEESHHEILDAKNSNTVIEDQAEMNRGIIDLSSKSLVHSEVELNTEDQVRTPPNTQKVNNDEQRVEQLWPDSQNTIPDEFLPSLNVYDQKSIMIHPSNNREVKNPKPKLRIRRPSKFKESPYTEKFGSAAGRSAGLICIFPQKHPFLYHSIDEIIYTKIVKNFMEWISADLLKATTKRKGKVEHYKREKSDIPMMHFGVETVEDKNWFYTMGFTNQTWTDSIEKIAKIIPLCLQGCDFYVKKGIDLQNHSRYKDKDSSDMFDVLFEDDLPQQSSESLDCGVFMVMYAECLSYGHKVIPTEFDPNALRIRYAAFLWDYEIRKRKQMQLVMSKHP
ncbi:hypothetical protein T459_05272 [Capsicum annuum]|uniref:Ubiquitin-like protease family profile domain-containing protein n=1 Tax=Capsicum annuum TaxID=4072 RepID=A0A2G3A7B9_CAPAN|nr:hypothetical protein T459_05272 [Capsicum annuum]